MVSRSIKFMRALLLVELLLVATRRVHGLETGVSIKDIKFKLNEKFLFNMKACPIPTMDIDFLYPNGVERVLTRPYVVDLHGSKKWLRTMSGRFEVDVQLRPHSIRESKEEEKDKKTPKWLKQWRKEFKEKHYELVKKGEGMSSCIIWSKKQRRICCDNYLDKQQEFGDRRDFKFEFCMGLVQTFVNRLLETSVLLAEDDEEKLEDELNKVLAKMAKERAEGETSVSLTPLYEVGIEKVVPDDDMHPLTEEEHERYEGEEKLLKFLVSMKQIEHLFLIEKESYVSSEHTAVYSTFMDAFQECLKKKRAAVSYHTAETRWTTCGPVMYGDFVAGYCADLAAVDPKAPELVRKPILKWESGAYEHLHDLLDPNNIDTGDSEEEGGDNNSQRVIVERRKHSMLRRAVRAEEYQNVDLFQVELGRTESTCGSADLAHACYAICCDSGYKMSYYCGSEGLRCIG